MNSIRQIAIQLPEGLQRLQLHLFANGLVGWSPQAEDMETASPDVNTTATQTISPQVSLRRALNRLDVNASEANQTDDGQESDHFADVDTEAGSDSESNELQQSHGMTDEEQIAAVQAFIVGDDTLNPSLQEAAWMAATQLVSSLADPSEYIEVEVIDSLSELQVRLHTIEGGLQLKIGQGIMARSIYIYGDDEASEADDEQVYHDTEEDEDVVRGGMNGRAVVSGSVASEEGVACPVCLSSYSSNVRMAALGCHHHVCNNCFRRLSRPRTCPICRAPISSHVEVIM